MEPPRSPHSKKHDVIIANILTKVMTYSILVDMSISATRMRRSTNSSKWTLILNEQFAGASLDATRWNITNSTAPVSNNLAVWRASNIIVNNQLEILSKAESINGYKWTSGNIQTYSPYKWATKGQYFRAEIRAKCPLQQGFWPAPLWFRPVLAGGGTTDGEIDLYEGWANQTPNFKITGTLHGNYTDSPHKQISRSKYFSQLKSPDPQGWHTYIIEKVPNRMDMWCDELLFGTWLSTDTNSVWPAGTYAKYYEVAGVRWALRCTMQIGGPYSSPEPDANNDWSYAASTMLIDYIKVWDWKG